MGEGRFKYLVKKGCALEKGQAVAVVMSPTRRKIRGRVHRVSAGGQYIVVRFGFFQRLRWNLPRLSKWTWRRRLRAYQLASHKTNPVQMMLMDTPPRFGPRLIPLKGATEGRVGVTTFGGDGKGGGGGGEAGPPSTWRN